MNENTNDKISQYDKLVVDIRNNISTRLADLMSKLLNSAQDKLFTLSDEADNNEDQTRYFELMNQVRNLKSEIADTFNARIKDYLVPKKDFEEKMAQQKKEIEEEELSLVDPDEMEGLVLVKGIGERAAARYREQLSHLEARFEHLALKTDTVFKEDALKPTNFCQAFDDALADHFDTTNKKLLFQMFDAEVANKLDALYDSINNRLIDADILPQIKLSMAGKSASRPSRARPTPAPETPDAAQEGGDAGYQGGDYGGGPAGGPAGGAPGGPAGAGAPGSGPAGGANISGFAMTAPPGGGYRGANYATQGAPGTPPAGGPEGAAGNAAAGDAAGGAPGMSPGGMLAGAPGQQGGGAPAGSNSMFSPADAEGGDATEYHHYTAGLPAGQVGRVLSNYIGAPFTPEARDKSSETYGEFFPASTPQYFGHQEILQALSGVQSMPQFSQPEQAEFDSEAIKKAVLEEIAKTSGGAVTKRINQIAEKTIDFIELIFDAIIEDEDISDTIKTLLLRLQIPIIKASMSDQEFFIYDDHPARVLLDTIAEVGVGITDHTDEMYTHLDKIVSGILGEFDLTTETFQTALDKLHEIIEEQEAIARAREEEEQQQLLRKHARATVLKALRKVTSGKTLPEAVHPLILKRWPTLMFNHYLQHGKENNGWVNMVLTLHNIVDSVQPISTPEQLAKREADKEALFEQTEEYLNSVSRSKKDVRQVMQDFRDTVEDMIADANFREEDVATARQVVAESPPEETPPVIEEEPEEKADIPPNVMPGMWFQVYMGEDQPPRRCKLSVIIVEDANLMFVNHKGELVVEKSFDEFEEELASEKSKAIMGHSAFDYAFKTVINRLN
ncbi:MAG TPA: DUF1631 family protein [Gammaproteobacteria bacterium]|nr:DUF1631 family protein [Gammaproteobacteria bacterium]